MGDCYQGQLEEKGALFWMLIILFAVVDEPFGCCPWFLGMMLALRPVIFIFIFISHFIYLVSILFEIKLRSGK